MEENLQVSESLVLRRFLGGAFFLLACPMLFFAVVAKNANAHFIAVLLLIAGLLFASMGFLAANICHSPRVRLRVTNQGLWVLPDDNDWNLLKKSKLDPVTLLWGEIVGVEDGGVWYGYRRLRFLTEELDFQLNTSFLDFGPRSIVSAIDQKLRLNRKQLVEHDLGMFARSGKWRVEAYNAAFE